VAEVFTHLVQGRDQIPARIIATFAGRRVWLALRTRYPYGLSRPPRAGATCANGRRLSTIGGVREAWTSERGGGY